MRRLVPTTILLVALLLATLAAAPGVSAQATADHPAVGAWLVDASPEDSTDPPELVTIVPGGIITDANEGWTGYGSWAATGDVTADATFLFPFADPECGCLVGYGTIRASIEVSEDGQSFAGTYTIEPSAAVAEAMGVPVGQLGPGDVTGQRIAVEPMGAPVGPLPAEAPAPAAPDGSPSAPAAPDGSPSAPAASPMGPEPSPAAAAGVQTLDVTLADFSVAITPTTVKAGQPITFAVTNAGPGTHEMVLERAGDDDVPLAQGGVESEIEDIAPGASAQMVWTISEPGTYQLACHIPGHYEKGMVSTFDVVE